MEKYKKFIDEVRISIDDFNLYLADNVKIKNIPELSESEPYHYLNVRNKEWKDYQFPIGCENAGVYIYAGYDENDSNKICAYIGKASMTSVIGFRLHKHFYGQLKQKEYEGNKYYHKDNILIELIVVIPIDTWESKFLAPSLEEFLITDLLDKQIQLLNKVGNT